MMLFRKLVIAILLVTMTFTGGCYTMRKKFTRKKKYQKEEPVYVDFKDYPSKPSKEAYIDYYLFVRGWLDDLVESLKKATSFKREKRAVNEAVMNMEQMMSFFNQEGKDKVYPLYEELRRIKTIVERNQNMNDVGRETLIRDIENFKRRFESNFNYSDAGQWMN